MRISMAPLMIISAIVLTACAIGQATSPPAASAGPVVGDWVLTGGSIDGVDAPVLDDGQITLMITGSTVGGIAACNHYGGDIAMGGDGLRLENLLQTEMACEEPIMAAESAYLAALARVRQIARDGEELVARGDGVELRFSELAATD